MENKLISHALVLQHKPGDAKLMYLVGINHLGEQVLITIRYRKTPIPIAQLCEHEVMKDGSIRIFFSDISVIHNNANITGGVPILNGFRARFVFDRTKFRLYYFFDDSDQSCEVMLDTAMPFIELIAKM